MLPSVYNNTVSSTVLGTKAKCLVKPDLFQPCMSSVSCLLLQPQKLVQSTDHVALNCPLLSIHLVGKCNYKIF